MAVLFKPVRTWLHTGYLLNLKWRQITFRGGKLVSSNYVIVQSMQLCIVKLILMRQEKEPKCGAKVQRYASYS